MSTVSVSLMMQQLSAANIIDSLTGKLSPRDQEHTPPTRFSVFGKGVILTQLPFQFNSVVSAMTLRKLMHTYYTTPPPSV